MRHLLLLPLIFGFLAAPLHSHACINAYSEAYDFQFGKSLQSYPVPIGHPIDTLEPKVLRDLNLWKQGLELGYFEAATNYGVYLIFAGRLEEAEAQLLEIHRRWPDKYAATANIGTLYEIMGRNTEALDWIRRAYAMDSTAHNGSEWIHLKILEAKAQDMEAFSASTLVGIDFGSNTLPACNLDRRARKQLQKQMFYQLNERMTFIRPKEAVIAGLLYELGNLTLSVGEYVSAFKTYQLAKAYGCEATLLPVRLKYARKHRPR